MAYDLTNLPSFTTQGKAFVIKSILESQTIKLLLAAGSFDPTAKGSNAIQLMDDDVQIQDGSNCGFTPLGGAVLSQAILNVKDLKINEEYCPRLLESTWAKGELQAGQNYDQMAFLNDITALNTAKASLKLENIVWQGTGTTVGFIPQIKASNAHIDLTAILTASGTTTYEKLAEVVAAMPIAVIDSPDFVVLVGKDVFNSYVATLTKANYYNPTAIGVVFGTNAKLVAVSGLNGGDVVATRLRNLQAGGEMTDVEFKSWYSQDFDTMRLSSRFSIGVVPVYPEEIGYGKIV